MITQVIRKPCGGWLNILLYRHTIKMFPRTIGCGRVVVWGEFVAEEGEHS